jgi:hypothetical protein
VDHGAVTPFLRDLLESIGLRKRKGSRIGLRPHREVVVSLGLDAAYERVLDAFVRILGANVYVDDRATSSIEAGFGTVNQERVRASLRSDGATHTRIHIEAYYPAGSGSRERSLAVEALADALEAGVGD